MANRDEPPLAIGPAASRGRRPPSANTNMVIKMGRQGQLIPKIVVTPFTSNTVAFDCVPYTHRASTWFTEAGHEHHTSQDAAEAEAASGGDPRSRPTIPGPRRPAIGDRQPATVRSVSGIVREVGWRKNKAFVLPSPPPSAPQSLRPSSSRGIVPLLLCPRRHLTPCPR